MTAPMSDAQFAAIRELNLKLVSTLLDGNLVVKEPDGTRLLLTVDGDLAPHAETTVADSVTDVRLSPSTQNS